ncbi:MAG: nitroreductase family protein [Dehalococcoidia bacterium]|nr:nitroreductase family protein [Dehalococcoidia bacterium]
MDLHKITNAAGDGKTPERATHTVDLTTCKKCHLCAGICPAGIIRADDEARFLADRIHLCIRCGQCMAACPTRSIFIEGLSYDKDFFPLPRREESWQRVFLDLISTRRSIRKFQDRPVPRDLLEKIVQAVTFAPPGFTPLTVELTVVNNRELIKSAVPLMAEMYDMLLKMQDNPESRAMLEKMVGKDTYQVLSEHVLPLMRARMPALKAGSEDTIARGAPCMILFHEPVHNEDVFIALAYALLAAHSLGLGACAIGLIPPTINRNPELKKMFKVPAGNMVSASMILGYPKYKYSRGIRRSPAGLTWIE